MSSLQSRIYRFFRLPNSPQRADTLPDHRNEYHRTHLVLVVHGQALRRVGPVQISDYRSVEFIAIRGRSRERPLWAGSGRRSIRSLPTRSRCHGRSTKDVTAECRPTLNVRPRLKTQARALLMNPDAGASLDTSPLSS